MNPSRRNVLLLCLLSGALLALAWPAIGNATPLIFIAWVPMLWAERLHDQRTEGRKRHFVPYAFAGLWVWNVLTTWWLGAVSEPTMVRVFTFLGPITANTALMVIPWTLKRWTRKRMGSGWAQLAFISFWLAFEHLHMDWDLSWPWLQLGNVFANDVRWVQWYEYVGTAGGSLWVLLVNLLVFLAVMQWSRGDARPKPAMAAVALIALPIGLSFLLYRSHEEDRGADHVDVVMVQPNIDPYNAKFARDPMEQLHGMLAQAERVITDSTDLLLLPETALQEDWRLDYDAGGALQMTGLWENDLEHSASGLMIRSFQQEHPGLTLLAGMSSAELFNATDHPQKSRVYPGTDKLYVVYNAALLADPQGPLEPYHKSRLVPGVELVPFEGLMGSLKGIALDLGGTTGSNGVQEEREVMRSKHGAIALAPVICYESIYGDHVAAHVRNGATLIALITNDAWWGDTPGFRQHLAYGRLRAIETRRCIARCANTGISCFVDQRGEIHQASDWWVPATLSASLRANSEITFFVRHGDLVGPLAVNLSLVVVLMVIALPWRFKRKAAELHP